MDSLLLLGQDEKLKNLFVKLGYSLTEFNKDSVALPNLTASSSFDLIFLDLRTETSGIDLCEFLRRYDSTKDIPILVLSENDQQLEEIYEAHLDKIECLKGPMSLGVLASKVATQLRLRKFAGADDNKSSVAEMNAMLRDLNDRFQKEIEEARSIQMGLLPEDLPQDPRMDMAVSYQPLDGVGGDWYFTRQLQNGYISTQIADVTGHGMSAALIASMTKLALFAADKEKPHELLQEMNRLMAPHIPQGRFVTMLCVGYDCETGRLDFSRAGHPPALLVKRKLGKVIQIKGEGFPIGFFPDSSYLLGTETLDVDDVVFIYTDGLSEAQNRSMNTYGLDRLSRVLLETPDNSSSGEIASIVLDDFDVFREDRIIKDDITLLVMRRSA